MKRLAVLVVLLGVAAMFWGCGKEAEVFETVNDVHLLPVSAGTPQYQVRVQLPQNAGLEQALSCDTEKVYTKDGGCCTYTTEILTAVSLESLLTELTGQPEERLTVIQTELYDLPRYDLCWTTAGEQGEAVCRAAVLDDGMHYYVVTASVPAHQAGLERESLDAMFASMELYGDEGF